MKNSSPVGTRSKEKTPLRLKGWKRWAFPLAAMVLIPALFFILLELGLKVANFGFPTEFLVKRKLASGTVFTDNPQYGWRFFPSKVARKPADIVLPSTKAPKVFRVFVLGESAAMGDPDPAFGIPRLLEVMLSERYPNVEFEVVNAAMTGISSHIIQDIAKDCAKYEPDCFVIYMGNNEAIGPYGPGTVFASFSRNLALTRLSINARSLKTSQLMDRLIKSSSKSEEPQAWGGLRVFMKSQLHPTDERLNVLGEHFEANLKTICESGLDSGAKLVLCTVASSLADCSPFASLNSPSLSVDQKKGFDAHWETGRKLATEGKTEAALQEYQKAEAIDSSYAELHFQIGALHSALKHPKEAHESFTRARDQDALRFRTASDLNERVKKVATTLPSSSVALADIVKSIEEESAGAGVGSGHFVDHVHFNFHGNYVAAREMFNAVSRFVPGNNSSGQGGQQTVLTEKECIQRLAYTRWNQMKIAQHMQKRFEIPPFNTKSDFTNRVQEFKAQLTQLQDASSTAGKEEAVAMHRAALQRKPSDPEFLRNLSELHGELEQLAEDVKNRELLYKLYPYDPDRKAYLAESYAYSGNHVEGEKLAREVLKVDSNHVIARLALAIALDKKGSLVDATKEYEQILKSRPDLVAVRIRLDEIARGDRGPVYQPTGAPPAAAPAPSKPSGAQGESLKRFQRGEALLAEGKVEEAVKELQIAIIMEPLLVEAHMALAGALVQQGKIEEAIARCKEALRLRPDFGQLHNNLGALLADSGRVAEANTHFKEAVRLDPNDSDAHLNLGLNLMKVDLPLDALKHFEIFIKKNPDESEVHLQMGILYENTGSWEKAAGSYRNALRIQPKSEQYLTSLAWILATSPRDEVRNGKEAVQLAEAACQSPKPNMYYLDALAAAFAEMERYPDAIKKGEEALALARASNDKQAIEDIGKRVSLYKSNKPFRSVAMAQAAATKP